MIVLISVLLLHNEVIVGCQAPLLPAKFAFIFLSNHKIDKLRRFCLLREKKKQLVRRKCTQCNAQETMEWMQINIEPTVDIAEHKILFSLIVFID